MPRLTPEEAQKFLNRLSKESLDHLKNSMKQRSLKRGKGGQEKEW
jgi:hypothetical protein